MIEILKGCVRCNALPKFSSYRFSAHTSCAVVCCTTISDKELDYAMMKWNNFNKEATTTFRLNRETQQWEPYVQLET
jgi:hypothetical protein